MEAVALVISIISAVAAVVSVLSRTDKLLREIRDLERDATALLKEIRDGLKYRPELDRMTENERRLDDDARGDELADAFHAGMEADKPLK